MLTPALRKVGLPVALGLSLSLSPVMAEESSAPEAQDPWEGFNRSMYTFNESLDRYAIKPLAQGYRFVMPDLAEQGVSNFFDNIGDIGNLVNNLLQFKLEAAGQDLARISFNTTFGLLGFVDVASHIGLPEHDEDFGQTLGYWGVESGPYLVLPFFGPSNVRDGVSLFVDASIDPVGDVDHVRTRNSLYGLRLLDTRSRLLQAEQIITGDKYSFIRDAYMQRREFLINDGTVEVQYDQDF